MKESERERERDGRKKCSETINLYGVWSTRLFFFLWSQSKLVVNGITLHKEYEWANLSKEAKYKHKNITDSRHAYSALLRSNQMELVQIQMVVSLDWCVSSDFESLVCSLLLALDIFAQSFFFLNFFSKIGYFFWKEKRDFMQFFIISTQFYSFSGFMWIKTVRFNLVLLTFNSKFDNSN